MGLPNMLRLDVFNTSLYVTGFGITDHFAQNLKIELLVLHDCLVFDEQNGN